MNRTRPSGTGKRRVCVVGGGVSGLSAAWALGQHPERFAVELYERNDDLGGNAVTVDIPQDDGTSIPVDISVTAYIPSVYRRTPSSTARSTASSPGWLPGGWGRTIPSTMSRRAGGSTSTAACRWVGRSARPDTPG